MNPTGFSGAEKKGEKARILEQAAKWKIMDKLKKQSTGEREIEAPSQNNCSKNIDPLILVNKSYRQ